MVGRVLEKIGPGSKAAVPGIVQALKDKKARDSQCFVQILGAVGPDAKEAVPTLISLVEDKELGPWVVDALCFIGPSAKPALPALARYIRKVQAEAGTGTYYLPQLAKLGPVAIPLLIELLEEKSVATRSQSAVALGEIGRDAKPAVPNLMKTLKDVDPEVRYRAAVALWEIEKNKAVIPALIDLVRLHDQYIAPRAAAMLGEIGPDAKEALPALREIFNPHPQAYGFGSGLENAATLAIRKIEGTEKQKD